MDGRGIWIGRGRKAPPVVRRGRARRIRTTAPAARRARRRRRRTWPRSRPSACRGPRAARPAAPGPRRGRAATHQNRPRGRGATTGRAGRPSPNFQTPRGRTLKLHQSSERAAARAGFGSRRTTPATASRSAARAVVVIGASPWPFVASRRATGSRPIQYRRGSPARSAKTAPRPSSLRPVQRERRRRSATASATASCRRPSSRRPTTAVSGRPSSSWAAAFVERAAPAAPS